MQILLALAYPIGFIFVIIGKSELFTEHTALAILPVLDKSVSVTSLLKLWGIVYAGNLLGGYVFAFMITKIGPPMEVIQPEAFEHLAIKMSQPKGWIIMGSGILAGWLMGLLGWMVTSSQETIGRIVVIMLITTVIGIGNMHHCIVGSIEVFSGLLVSSEVRIGDYLHFQGWATLGNAIGGVVFVALVKYSHIKASKT
jgi:formate/nitrite transporter FocA (FNT family)